MKLLRLGIQNHSIIIRRPLGVDSKFSISVVFSLFFLQSGAHSSSLFELGVQVESIGVHSLAVDRCVSLKSYTRHLQVYSTISGFFPSFILNEKHQVNIPLGSKMLFDY